MARRRNVLFILIDQLRADLLHGPLADHVDLPNLRAFMDEAVAFRRHYSVCNPCGPLARVDPDRAICDEPPLRPQRHAAAP